MSAAVRSLAELGDSEQVWVAYAVKGAIGHRDGRSGIAACNALVVNVPITAGHLRTGLSGRLCRICWGGDQR